MANKAEELLTLFKEKGWTLGSVESMTAGLFGATVCSVPGASKVYRGGIISYHPGVKVKLAGVCQKDIDTYGVVSKEIAKEMAEGGRKALEADCVISITGNAGPTAEPGEAPVGEIDMAVASNKETYIKQVILRGNRNEIREAAVEKMIEFLLEIAKS